MNWYIESERTDEKYLEMVKSTMTPCMNYICDKLYEIKDLNKDDIEIEFTKIVNTMPILKIYLSNDEPYIVYNKQTDIKFSDGFKQILREIKLKQLLE